MKILLQKIRNTAFYRITIFITYIICFILYLAGHIRLSFDISSIININPEENVSLFIKILIFLFGTWVIISPFPVMYSTVECWSKKSKDSKYKIGFTLFAIELTAAFYYLVYDIESMIGITKALPKLIYSILNL